jgi:hypothetical protein
VSERTVADAPPVAGLASPRRSGARTAAGPRELIREHPAASAGIGLVLLSTLIVLWAGTRPGFDPYGWLVWGHQTLHLSLNTNGAPSWKPLPYLFTVPYALTGKSALWLWMVTAVSFGLAGVLFAGRIAYRLTAAPPERRYAALAAGAFAGLALLGIRDYMHYILSAQSDTIIVTLCLAAVDAYLCGRRRLAYALGVLAALGRPEAWPFLGLYALWLGYTEPATRALIAGGLVAIAALWFGIPWITADSPFVAGNLALHSSRALHSNRVLGTLDRFLDLHEWPLQLAALAAVPLAAIRRDRATLILAAGAAAWVAVEIAFALHGWPGLPRYMFEAAGIMVVLAGVAVGRLLVLAETPRLTRVPAWIGAALVLALVAGLAPAAVSRIRGEHKDLFRERGRTRQIDRLAPVIARLGGIAAIRACGQPATEIEFQSIVAWTIGTNVGKVGYYPTAVRRRPHTQVLFRSAYHGWSVRPLHVTSSHRAACARMRAHTAVS